MYVFNDQLAVYVLSPVLPLGIVTVVSGVSPFEPVHPVNVYPGFVGFSNVITLFSTVYDVVGFVCVPPSNEYVMLYPKSLCFEYSHPLLTEP